MLRTVIWYVSHATLGYLFGCLLNSAYYSYDKKRARKQFEEALAAAMLEDDSIT